MPRVIETIRVNGAVKDPNVAIGNTGLTVLAAQTAAIVNTALGLGTTDIPTQRGMILKYPDSGTSNGSALEFQKIRDDEVPQWGDTIGQIKFGAWDGNSWEYPVLMTALTDGNAENNNVPGAFSIAVQTDGAGVAATALNITNDKTISFYGAIAGSVESITATSAGVAASLTKVTTEISTNGDSDLDNVTLANGTQGQIKIFTIETEAAGGDSVKITPANALGFTQITFDGTVGQGCIMVYNSTKGWTIIGNNGGTIA